MPYYAPAGGADGFNNVAAGTQTANTTGTVVFSNSNNVSFGMSNNSLVTASASYPSQTNQNNSLFALGNTTQNSSTVLNASALSFNALGAATMGYSNGSIQMSVPVQTQFVLSNSNGVSFGTNGSTVTATVATNYQSSNANYLTSQSNQAASNSAGSFTFQTLNFSNANNVTFGTSAGGIITASVAATVASNTPAVSNSAGSFTFSTLNFSNANNVTFGTSAGGIVTASVAAPGAGGGIGIAAGTRTATTAGSLLFDTGNGITFGLNAVGGSIMTASHNGLTQQSTQPVNASASNGSFNFSTLAFSNANNVTFGTSAGSIITASVAATVASNTPAVSNSAGSFTFSTLNFSNANNVTFGTSAGGIVTASVAAPGGGGAATLSYFRYPNNAPFNASSSQSFGISTMAIQPFQLPFNVSASYMRQPVSVGFGSTTFASGANTTHSLRQTNTYYAIIYSQGVGASASSIQSVYSSSLSDVMQIDARVGAASNNQTVSHFFTFGATGNSSIGFTTGYSPAASSIVRVSTTHLTAFTGARFLDIPFATLLAPGNYWLGIQVSSATAVSGTAAMNQGTQKVSYYNITQVSANINEMGANTTAGSNMWQGFGHGNWTTNTSGRTTASINLAQVSTVANQPIFPFEFRRQA